MVEASFGTVKINCNASARGNGIMGLLTSLLEIAMVTSLVRGVEVIRAGNLSVDCAEASVICRAMVFIKDIGFPKVILKSDSS